MTRSRSVLAAIVLLASLAACAGSQPAATPTPATPTLAPAATMMLAPVTGTAPFHAIPADSMAVDGTAGCEVTTYEVECELDMSDPRVSGTEHQEGFHYMVPGLHGRVWVVERAVITNATGSWRGSAQGAESFVGIPSGEAHYSGEGAYAGLEFHYYFWHADLNGPVELRGWISGSSSAGGDSGWRF